MKRETGILDILGERCLSKRYRLGEAQGLRTEQQACRHSQNMFKLSSSSIQPHLSRAAGYLCIQMYVHVSTEPTLVANRVRGVLSHVKRVG